jgi:hypothetical protein
MRGISRAGGRALRVTVDVMNTFLKSFAAAALVFSSACAQGVSDAHAPETATICYASPDGRLLRSTLSVTPESGGERLVGVTELRAEARELVRVVEKANLDASGRLLHLEATATRETADSSTTVVLDATTGRVEVTRTNLHVVWTVPTDLPWVWVPILTEPRGQRPIATPLEGRVVLRATGSGRPVRRIDLGALVTHPMTADQLVVSEAGGATVVLGDDALDVENDRVKTLHVAALGISLETVEPTHLVYADRSRAGCPAESRE